MKNKKGFTLIELLIVIAIIGLLATLAIVSLTTAQRKARDTKRVADVKSIQSAMELYYSTNARYPYAATWDALGTKLSPYITQMPVDPQNNGSSVYTVLVNAVSEGSSTPDQYVIGSVLEDSAHQALAQDDDNNYTGAVAPGSPTGWITGAIGGLTSLPGTVTTLDCSGSTVYCLGE